MKNCHRKQRSGYKYHLCIEKETDALVILWPPQETRLQATDEGDASDRHLIYKSVFSTLSTGWDSDLHTSWHSDYEIYSAQLHLHPWLRR